MGEPDGGVRRDDANVGSYSELRDSIPDRIEDFSEWQPKVSLTWRPSETWTVFGSWGIGFKSGGFNNSSTSETVEFYVGSFGLLRVVENIDRAEIQGFELGGQAYLTDSLSLSIAYSQVDGEIKEFALRTNTVGNEIPNAADYTLNVGAQYVHPLFDSGLNFFARLDYMGVGDTWFHAVQDDTVAATLQGLPAAVGTDLSRSQREAFGFFNARIGVESDKWSASIFAENFTDEDFLGEVLVVPEFGGSFVHPGSQSERFIGIEFDYRFF